MAATGDSGPALPLLAPPGTSAQSAAQLAALDAIAARTGSHVSSEYWALAGGLCERIPVGTSGHLATALLVPHCPKQ